MGPTKGQERPRQLVESQKTRLACYERDARPSCALIFPPGKSTRLRGSRNIWRKHQASVKHSWEETGSSRPGPITTGKGMASSKPEPIPTLLKIYCSSLQKSNGWGRSATTPSGPTRADISLLEGPGKDELFGAGPDFRLCLHTNV